MLFARNILTDNKNIIHTNYAYVNIAPLCLHKLQLLIHMIKTFIIVAVSADGFIAKDENHPAYWTGKEDKKRFIELTKRAGVVVMGSTTYQTLKRPLADRTNLVYSRSKKVFDGAETVHEKPTELLQKLEARGFKELAICGGSYIYTMFLKAHCVDKIYLTIEPKLFGVGINIFNELVNFDLKLISHEVTETGALLLEYDINYHGGKITE
jgi:dihydrofolate reductase